MHHRALCILAAYLLTLALLVAASLSFVATSLTLMAASLSLVAASLTRVSASLTLEAAFVLTCCTAFRVISPHERTTKSLRCLVAASLAQFGLWHVLKALISRVLLLSLISKCQRT